jgi:hypothetical protein
MKPKLKLKKKARSLGIDPATIPTASDRKPRMVGKWTPDENTVKKIEFLAGQGLSIEQISHVLNISRDTFDRYWKNPDNPMSADIADAINRGRSKGVGVAVNSLFENVKRGELGSIIWYLKNVNPQNWRDRVQTELSGPDGKPIQTEDATNYSDEERTDRILALLTASRVKRARQAA